MNNIYFLIKFIYNKRGFGGVKLINLFPFIGVILGCIVVCLTFAIMEGIEIDIYTKLKNVSFESKIINIKHAEIDTIQKLLSMRNIKYSLGNEGHIVAKSRTSNRLVTITGIENINIISSDMFGNNIKLKNIISEYPIVYIGQSLSAILNVSLGDTINIISTSNINIFTGMPSSIKAIISGIYKLDILDYDSKYMFTDYSSIEYLINSTNINLYIHDQLDFKLVNTIKEIFSSITIYNWDENHKSFISAMKLEKIIYSIIGFIIVAIASFTLTSIMCMDIMRKIPQIGILKAMGAKRIHLNIIFIIQALITWIISSTTGVLLSIIFIKYDIFYSMIQWLAPNALLYSFPLILDDLYIYIVMFISLILLLFASLYPSLKSGNMDIVQSISLKR